MILHNAKRFTETLIMNDFTLSKETDRITYFRIFHKTQNVVIGCSGFLFWGDLVSTTYTKI